MKAIASIAALMTLTVAISFTAQAQFNVMSNDDLLNGARNAGRAGQWINAYAYLVAYIQRDPPELSDSAFLDEITGAVGAALFNAQAANRTSGGGGGTAGVIGKGDTFASDSGGDFSVPATPVTPRTYPLRCQGGGDMSLFYNQSGGIAEVSISFGRSPSPATERYPGAGRCAWLDRPVGANEFSRISWLLPSQSARIVNLETGGPDWASANGLPASSRMVARLGSLSGSGLEELLRGVRNGRLFQVQCYNNRRGACRVTNLDWVR